MNKSVIESAIASLQAVYDALDKAATAEEDEVARLEEEGSGDFDDAEANLAELNSVNSQLDSVINDLKGLL